VRLVRIHPRINGERYVTPKKSREFVLPLT
jgi:hypothetical protein